MTGMVRLFREPCEIWVQRLMIYTVDQAFRDAPCGRFGPLWTGKLSLHGVKMGISEIEYLGRASSFEQKKG